MQLRLELARSIKNQMIAPTNTHEEEKSLSYIIIIITILIIIISRESNYDCSITTKAIWNKMCLWIKFWYLSIKKKTKYSSPPSSPLSHHRHCHFSLQKIFSFHISPSGLLSNQSRSYWNYLLQENWLNKNAMQKKKKEIIQAIMN